LETIRWKDGVVVTIDQTRLPHKVAYLKLKTPKQIATAITNMNIRGAPLLGATAALALAQTAYRSKAATKEKLIHELERTAVMMRKTRPTAVNLFNSIDTVLQSIKNRVGNVRVLSKFVIRKCLELVEYDAEVNKVLSLKGANLIESGDTVLTHCNAGELATVRYGTALGVIKMAYRQGKEINVIATETRPLLQGSRLTAFELMRESIPVTLITDNMVGYAMQIGLVKKVVVGADRIILSGHVTNKIGTYSIAVLAKKHRIPFYVAAPISTIDNKQSVEEIVIEERNANEVLEFLGKRTAPKGVKALNPAFDITPPELVSGIITERGVLQPKPEHIRKALVGASF